MTCNAVNIYIHELNHSGVCMAAIAVSNALSEQGYNVNLVVIGEGTTLPTELNAHVGLIKLGAKRGQRVTGKILYLLSSSYKIAMFARERKIQNSLFWGKEFTSIAVFLRILSLFNSRIVVLWLQIHQHI